MRRLINRLPITKIKLFLAAVLYRIVHVAYRGDKRIVVRNGIKYEVDLSEGIDLSMFLLIGREHMTARVKDHAARAGRPLVDGCNVLRHHRIADCVEVPMTRAAAGVRPESRSYIMPTNDLLIEPASGPQQEILAAHSALSGGLHLIQNQQLRGRTDGRKPRNLQALAYRSGAWLDMGTVNLER